MNYYFEPKCAISHLEIEIENLIICVVLQEIQYDMIKSSENTI